MSLGKNTTSREPSGNFRVAWRGQVQRASGMRRCAQPRVERIAQFFPRKRPFREHARHQRQDDDVGSLRQSVSMGSVVIRRSASLDRAAARPSLLHGRFPKSWRPCSYSTRYDLCDVAKVALRKEGRAAC